MKVFVLGASGAIGFPVAKALARAGYIVYGLTRSRDKALQLATEEIIPVISELSNPEAWFHLLSTIDVVIDTIGGTANLREFSEMLLGVLSDAAKQLRPPHASKISFICTSGIWVHGENREEYVTDSTPPNNPAEIVAWRVEHEQRVITSTDFNGIVIRPAMVYGRGGSLFSLYFRMAYSGETLIWPSTPGGRLSVVHTDDLADLYVKVAEKAPILGGKIIDGANDLTESVDDFFKKLVTITGARGHEYREPQHVLEQAIGTTTLVRPYLARTLVGWKPRKRGLVDGLEMYYIAFLASLNNQKAHQILYERIAHTK